MKISIRDKKADLTKKYEDIYSGKNLVLTRIDLIRPNTIEEFLTQRSIKVL